MGFIVIIPARLASTRLPNKPLADLGGKPMVVRVAERAQLSGAARIIVATDHDEIAAACIAHGVEVRMTRGDHPSGTDRIAEVARALELADDAVVVNLQGDEPLIDPALLAATAALVGAGVPMATCAHPISDVADVFNPNVVKVVLDKHGRALYFSRRHSVAPGCLCAVAGRAAGGISTAASYRPVRVFKCVPANVSWARGGAARRHRSARAAAGVVAWLSNRGAHHR